MDKRSALDALRRAPAPETPPINGRRPGLWYLAGAILLATLLAALIAGWFLRPRPVPVRTVMVTEENAASASVLNAEGYVVAQMQTTVASQITGMVTEVYVKGGEHVEKGQIVARLDDRALRAQLAAVQELLRAQEAETAAYRALSEKYRKTFERYRALASQNAISDASLDEAQGNYLYNRALTDYYRGLAGQSRHTVALYRTQLSYGEIRAPFSGVVTERYAHPGEMISPSAVGGFTQTGICTIVDMTSLEVEVDVNEAYITRIRKDQQATVVLDAYPGWRIPARVLTIVQTANRQKATVKVRLGFTDLDPRILPQMSAQVWFEADRPDPGSRTETGLFIPAAAFRRDAGGSFVFRIDGNRVRRTSVRLARRESAGNRLRILSGLQSGDRIVTSSNTPLRDGEKVEEQ